MLGTKINKPILTQEECDNYTRIAEWCNSNNCSIEDKGEYFEVVAIIPYEPTKEDKIEALKAELASYDYIGIKISMGVATVEEYADKIAYTEQLRKQINDLQK